MQAVITEFVEKDTQACVWCEKESEGVVVEFSDGFLSRAPLCWKCLTKAVKVRSKQEQIETIELSDVRVINEAS